jgi:hypothetical protein
MKKHAVEEVERDYCGIIMNRQIIIKSHYQFDKLPEASKSWKLWLKNFVVVSTVWRYDFSASMYSMEGAGSRPEIMNVTNWYVTFFCISHFPWFLTRRALSHSLNFKTQFLSHRICRFVILNHFLGNLSSCLLVYTFWFKQRDEEIEKHFSFWNFFQRFTVQYSEKHSEMFINQPRTLSINNWRFLICSLIYFH